MAAKWPISVATDADLSIAVNGLQTTLSSAIDAVVTSIPLVSTSGFPTTGYVTLDAEVIAYTGVSGGNLTGATRGADGTVASAHLASAPVGATIVAAHHNALKDEVKATESWLDTVLGKGTAVTAPEFERVDGVTAPIQGQIDAVVATANSASSAISAIDRLRVTAQSTPGTTVAVAAGVYTKSDGTATVTFAGGNSPAFAVVSANSRIDLLTINDSGVLAITQGTQAASPVAPTYPTDKMVLAQVTVSQTTGPAITQAMIKDVRPYLNLGGGGSVTLRREDYIVGTALNNYTGSLTVFDLVSTYTVGGNVMVVVLDGDVQTKGASADYLETDSDTITFNTALVAGERISFLWSSTAGATSGTVNSGTANAVAYYAATGTAVSSSTGPAVNAAGYIKGTLIQQVTLTSTTSTTSSGTAYTSTALSQAFTCLSATSKLKITAMGILGNTSMNTSGCTATIFRDATDLSGGAGFAGVNNGGTPTGQVRVPCTMIFVDAPGDTSSHTYVVKIKSTVAANSTWNSDAATTYLLLEEIAA